MADLILHCGAHAVSEQQVHESTTPERTRTWVPIAHGELLRRVKQSLISIGQMKVVNEAHALTPDAARYFGMMEVVSALDQSWLPSSQRRDYRLVVGIRNSHDKRFPAGLVVGSAVCVCDNLSFSGEISLSRKHTRFIRRDLPLMVNRAVGQLGNLRHQQDHRFSIYRQTQMTDADAHDLMIQAMDCQVLPSSRLPKVLEEWRSPCHEEFKQDGYSSWRLFNAFTEALKGKNLEVLPRRTQALHGLMDRYCGLN